VKKRFGLPNVGELGDEEDEEMGELPVLDDNNEEDEEESLYPLKEAGDDEEDHSLVEAARDAADDDNDLESGEDENAEDSWGGEGDCDMSVELPGGEERLGLEEEDASFEVPDNRGEDDDEVVNQDAHLRELHDGSGSSAVPPEDDVSAHDKSISFTRELSVEEEEEEELEEESVDRELSLEPRDEEEEAREALTGNEEKSVFDATRTYQSRQARSSSSGRWDKPLRPSDFGQSSPGFARSRPQQQQDVDKEGTAGESMVDVEDGSSSGDEGESLEEGVVTITSNDPLAAARAAAILKLVSD